VIEDSRIHGCGASPSTNQDHGIYVANSVGLVIRENWIYENTDRGIQLYPNAVGTQVYDNVITDNGEGVIVSEGSTGNVIRNNVIANSKIRWNIEASNLHGTGNLFAENCVWSEAGGYYGSNGGIMPAGERGPGLTVVSNTVMRPQFQDPSAANFTTSSPCLSSSLGIPASTTPQAPATEVAVTLQPPATQVPQGTPVTLRGTVSGAEHAQTETGAPTVPVTIQVFQNDHWRKLAKTRADKSGNFKVRKKFGRRIGGKKVHLRAKVASYGPSRSVTVRFRS
jgi:parallel beta-helix repeat protein